MFERLWRAFLRWAFHHFYNTFAFTYDFVSAVVSRGHWRAWTRAAMPFIKGRRVLEMPCGTGNLLLDLCAARYAPIGVDLSPAMLRITQRKLQRNQVNPPILRARAQALPFANATFDSITMTFPPGFVTDPSVLAELARVLRNDGRLIWVDSGRLLPRDVWSRTLNRALDVVNAGAPPFADFARDVLTRAGFQTQIEIIHDAASAVTVIVATQVNHREHREHRGKN